MDTIQIRDLNVAAFLFATDQVRLKSINRSEKIVFFNFTPVEETEKLLESYWTEKAPLIQAKKLFDARRDLQDMIFGRKFYEEEKANP